MSQTDLFCEAPAPASDRYAWQEGISAGGNPYYRLIEHGEETRWWVRHKIACRSGRPWFIVTDFAAYVCGDFASLRDAQERLLSIKRGEYRV